VRVTVKVRVEFKLRAIANVFLQPQLARRADIADTSKTR
jgi:hypothetical protein